MPESEIVANIRDTLERLLDETGVTLFDSVSTAPAVDTFVNAADPLQRSAVAIVVGDPERRQPTENDLDFVCRVPVQVVVKVNDATGTDADGGLAIELARLADLIRDALDVDPLRDGNAARIMFGGEYIPGTRVHGAYRQYRSASNDQMRAAVIDVVCGYQQAL
jgi:hypothetical protein